MCCALSFHMGPAQKGQDSVAHHLQRLLVDPSLLQIFSPSSQHCGQSVGSGRTERPRGRHKGSEQYWWTWVLAKGDSGSSGEEMHQLSVSSEISMFHSDYLANVITTTALQKAFCILESSLSQKQTSPEEARSLKRMGVHPCSLQLRLCPPQSKASIRPWCQPDVFPQTGLFQPNPSLLEAFST